jgi:TetR/AcrR family transcriptional regulator, regulator of cefoperazone and chloramphenicol sensitivity
MNTGCCKKCSRDALIEAAAKLFAKRGYDAVSTRELAEAAGTNLGAIQYHFGSKAKLFVATLDHLWDKVERHPITLLGQDPFPTKREGALDRLAKFLVYFLAHILNEKSEQPGRIMCREIFASASEDPEMLGALISTVVKEFSRPYQDLMTRLLALLSPQRPLNELIFDSRSLLAQCVFYTVHRPFVEEMVGVNLTSEEFFRKMTRQIMRYSLSAMRLSDEVVAAGEQAVSRCLDSYFSGNSSA